MGKLVISANASLDGVVQDPDGSEGFATGGWFASAGSADLAEWARLSEEETRGAAALLLGRRSDEWFAHRWQHRTGAWAEAMNSLPKFVVSSTREPVAWSNAILLDGELAAAVSALTETIDGDILVYASARLARALLEQGLVDEIRVFLFPVILGQGQRLFDTAAAAQSLRLRSMRTVGESLLWARYEKADA